MKTLRRLRDLADAVPDAQSTASELRAAARAHRDAAETVAATCTILAFLAVAVAIHLTLVRDS